MTPTGPLPIEQLQPGMLVVARSDTGPLVNVPVTSARTHVADETLLFSFVGGASLQTTAEHPVYVEGIGYQPARQLAVGTVVRTATGQATVRSLSTLSGPTQVYDLSVESPHNFFAGSAQAQVHNKWIVDWVKSAVKNARSWLTSERRVAKRVKGKCEQVSRKYEGLATADDPLEGHHGLPKEHKKEFDRAGVDIEEWKMRVARSKHRMKNGRGLHTKSGGNWNRMWGDFFEESKDPSSKQILEKLEEMIDQFGLLP